MPHPEDRNRQSPGHIIQSIDHVKQLKVRISQSQIDCESRNGLNIRNKETNGINASYQKWPSDVKCRGSPSKPRLEPGLPFRDIPSAASRADPEDWVSVTAEKEISTTIANGGGILDKALDDGWVML
ncbi:hypothetical protein MMC13_003501 [Lambiella insularis]|nr:hypothetical protein [Lambiella insularis]